MRKKRFRPGTFLLQFDKQYHLGERNVIPYPVSKMHLFEAATHLNVVVFLQNNNSGLQKSRLWSLHGPYKENCKYESENDTTRTTTFKARTIGQPSSHYATYSNKKR